MINTNTIHQRQRIFFLLLLKLFSFGLDQSQRPGKSSLLSALCSLFSVFFVFLFCKNLWIIWEVLGLILFEDFCMIPILYYVLCYFI